MKQNPADINLELHEYDEESIGNPENEKTR